ncbi:MAG: helix-turn-helix domain-containing protein [Planctomycetota bacterium]|nr:helix-turn-helix domain-containing protein [Planctomycetota bacterium]
MSRTVEPPAIRTIGGLSPRAAAADIGVSISTIYVLLADGRLESYRIGRARRITRRSINALVDDNRVEPRGQ